MSKYSIKDIVFLDTGHCPCCCKRYRESPAYMKVYKKNVSSKARELLREAGFTKINADFPADPVGYAIKICDECHQMQRDISHVPEVVKYMILSQEFEVDWDEFQPNSEIMKGI